MNNVVTIDHPILNDAVTRLRMKDTPYPEFRSLVNKTAEFLAYEIAKSFPTEEVAIETPLAATSQPLLVPQEITLVPILRAGFGMVEGFLHWLPQARVSMVGVYRDHETLEPVEYYSKLHQEISGHRVIVVDPMLATGGTFVHTLDILKKAGVKEIDLAVLLASTEGIDTVLAAHPDVHIYTCAVDEELNDQGYIVPGLGDAGDRIFGTGEI